MTYKALCITLMLLAVAAFAQADDLGTGFTYQGTLNFNDDPANGSFDFEVELFDVANGGTRIGDVLLIEDVATVDGIFALELDFGALPFNGDQLWLSIGIREGASSGGYTGLLPRQKITATPYALHSETVAAGAVGTNEINSTQVQRRVSGNCTAGSFVTAVNQNGTVTCAADDTGLSTVTGAEIVDGTVGPDDIISSANYTLGAATINGPLNLNGALTIDSGQDIKILDDFNGFRWFDSDGFVEFAAITARANDVAFRDASRSRDIFHSNANGIGVGTSAPLAGHAVTMPSLNVTGQTEVGLTRVSAAFEVNTNTSACHSHGNLACFVGSGSVQCPVGTRVLGGGTNGSAPRFGSMGASYPSSETAWSCSMSYDLSVTRTCYAICARLE